ncbi:MAG TPA: hypothetical protein VK699_15480 [Terriglobales bacterium]|jgi:hypothetical protein|nr:hypothetical protein [Terriglobales bacterium]
MGFLDFLFGKSKNICPTCGTKGARASDVPIRCPNPSCQYFDSTLGQGWASSFRKRYSDYSPTKPIPIRYNNFQGEQKIFTVDARSLQRKKNHIVVCVAPTGLRISLSRDRIQNLREVEQALPQQAESARTGPTTRERQVLGYHKKHKTTSPLYEQIRAKYPNW